MNKRLLIFLIVFVGMNLVFVPLLSLYGLRVCPVLSISGFGFGCYYTAAYIVMANLLNLVLITVTNSSSLAISRFFPENRFWIYGLAYLMATLAALVVLQYQMDSNHLSGSSRAPEILALASFLLGLTQAYGLNWALQDHRRAGPRNSNFRLRWLSHVLRTLLPVLVVVAVLLHFLISQSQSFNEGRIAALASHDDLIAQTAYVILFLVAWLIITLVFHFLSELDQVSRVQSHLQHLQELDLKFHSELGNSWGLWEALLEQLNAFSKILGERTRLLNSFSRFVAAGVAESALNHEITQTDGVTKELTVVMSDIRNFTSMSEILAPNQVVKLLNEYFSAMLDVISHFQIHVDKFIGDGILAYVEPEEQTNPDEENRLAVDAALAMIERVEKLNVKLAGMNLPALKIGVGIFRGPLVIGLIGSEAKLQHTIIGDTVNRTARLESLCKELGVSIVISAHVWRSLNDQTRTKFKSYGKQAVKGIAVPMEVFGGPQEA